MNTRPLNAAEQANLAMIRDAGLDCAFLFLTANGLKKSILDAVLPLRTLLRESGLHDFSSQSQGEPAKVQMSAILISENQRVDVGASLYRPVTKQGDPRIWFSRLPRYAQAEDVLAIAIWQGSLVVFNLTRNDLQKGAASPANALLKEVRSKESPATELLRMLQNLAARGPLRAVCSGDTAVGRTLETALNIPINCCPISSVRLCRRAR